MKRSRLFVAISFMAVIWLWCPSITAAAPRIGLSPDAGPPTSKVTVKGKGFFPNVEVDIYFDTLDQALVTTSPRGDFSLTIDVPAAAQPGKHWITAKERPGRISPRAAQKPFLVRTDWAQFGFGSEHQGWNPYENTLDKSNVDKLELAWSISTLNNYFSFPAVAGGVVYSYDLKGPVGVNDSGISAFNAKDGKKLWNTPLSFGQTLRISPAVADGFVYVGTDLCIYALNAASGDIQWQTNSSHDNGGNIDSSVAVANGAVYASVTFADMLHALKARDGSILWTRTLDNQWDAGYGNDSPAVAGGVVYATSADGHIYAFKTRGGKPYWKNKVSVHERSSPAVANGVVYVGAFDGTVYAVKADTGVLLWRTRTDGYASSPAVAQNMVFVAGKKNLYAFRTEDGALIWSVPTGGYATSPAVANGLVYVGLEDGNLYALNSDNGTLLWSGYTGSPITPHLSGMVVADGMVFVSNLHSLCAFSLYGRREHPAVPRPDPGTLTPDRSLTPRSSQ